MKRAIKSEATKRKKRQLPMQPIVRDSHGVMRFRENRLVSYLLDFSSQKGMDLNALAILPGFSSDERAQLAQLIGYSVCGYGELGYVSNEAHARATRAANRLGTK